MDVDPYKFKLAWRWTDPAHALLPADIMAQIKPLEHADLPHGMVSRGEIDRSVLGNLRMIRTGNSPSEVGPWLCNLSVSAAERIIIRWDHETAVETRWDVFTRYWDDFCYPGSDDIEIFAPGGERVLLFRHEESFEWAQRDRDRPMGD